MEESFGLGMFLLTFFGLFGLSKIQLNDLTILVVQLAGLVFVPILGAVLHFTFGWSGNNRVVGVFSAVNESMWEHMKMAFWPFFLFIGLEYVVFDGKILNLFFSGMVGVVLMLIVMPTLIYTYVGKVKRHILAVDICFFTVSIIIGQLVNFALISDTALPMVFDLAGLIILTGLAACFVLFTFRPPLNDLFKDSVTEKYGY
ncbi:MAG: hypothetical protein GX638_02470 [Crenarchaeota archaeon]|nr:hypothetical protein [Thermoproteota archaeon]